MRGWGDERLRDENDCSYEERKEWEGGKKEMRSRMDYVAITAISVKLHNDG